MGSPRDFGGDVAYFEGSRAEGSTGALIGFSGGISGGMSSSKALAGAFTSTALGGLVASVSAKEMGAATAGFDVTLKAGGGRTLFTIGGEEIFSTGP